MSPAGASYPNLPIVTMPGAHTSLLSRWSEVAQAIPDRTALSSPTESYTFAEADRLSDQVASRIAEQLPHGDEPIGTLLGQTALGIIGLLGIMKAGRITVILDPHLPTERLRDIIELSGLTGTLVGDTAPNVKEALASDLGSLLDLDEMLRSGAGEVNQAALEAGRSRGGRDAVTIVFTSGSTGKPKGVVQVHDQMLNDVGVHRELTGLSPDDRVALVLPYGFAAGFSLVLGSLLNGAGIWSFDPRDGGARALVSWITEQQLTTLHSSPHLLRTVVGALPRAQKLDSLRFALTVGEAISAADIIAAREHLRSDAQFFNWTGSSEIGTLTIHEVTREDLERGGPVPAGKIVTGRMVTLLREDGTEAAQGESGELVAVSEYLSEGYWNDPETNTARFSVWSDGRRACRQGDLARFDENGNLILLGRSDAAVKVRGYLVEPAEVEAALMKTGVLAEATVQPIIQPPEATRLTAYIVAKQGVPTESPTGLRKRLRQTLPEYMVPASIVYLSSLPRNERGKVDRKQLPPPPPAAASQPPSNQWEMAIADIWSDMLGLPSVGADDDFMALGGDSLAIEEMLAQVTEHFGVDLVSSDLIQAPTLREFAQRLQLGSSALPSHPDVVRLQTGTTADNLFTFAGAGALALGFLPIARHFPERSVYGFQAHGMERRSIPDWSVESAARRYLELLRVIQPHGPYFLVGHSHGGLIAMEIAAQLTAAGEEVEMLGLLDTYLPGRVKGVREVPSATGAPAPHNSDSDASASIRAHTGTSAAVRRAAGTAGARVRSLARLVPPPKNWGRWSRAMLAGVVPRTGQRQFDTFFDQAVLASLRHKVSPYAGQTVLIFADDNPDGPLAWRDTLIGPHEISAIETEHTTMLREPHASVLASRLKSAFGSPPE